MGVSFQVARSGTRYQPKSRPIEDNNADDNVSLEGNFADIGEKVSDLLNDLAKRQQRHSALEEIEVSFSLNLFTNGFSVGKVSQLFNDVPDQLYPYDRGSESLISAIEHGWLPGDTLDDLPFKYVNGSILCQIQDYRNCFFHGGGIRSTKNNPIVHRVILHVCMENVVKDILSISDDSWTYKDLLEFESRVLKALQPNLCLDPQPLPYKHCREPLAKKVNLEIAWSWKKREHRTARASSQVFSNSCHVTETPGNSARQNSNFLTSLVHQDGGVMCAKENIPTSVLNQEHNLLQEMKIDSNALTSQPSYQNRENRDLSALAELPTPNVSSFERSSLKRPFELTPSSSNLSVKVRRQEKASQSSLPKKPKTEPVDYFFQQVPGKMIEISAPLELQWNGTSLHQHNKVGKGLQEIFQGKACHSQFIKSGQPANHEGTTIYSQAGSATSKVKLEPVKAWYPSSQYLSAEDNHVGKDRRVKRCDGVQAQHKQSSHLIKTNGPPLNTLQNPSSSDKCLLMGNVTGKRKILENPPLTYDGSAPASSQSIDSLQVVASASSRQNKSSPKGLSGNVVDSSVNMNDVNMASANRWKTDPPKGFSANVVDLNVNMNNVNMANAKSLLEGNHRLSQPSEMESDLVLERLQKIGGVTQRYELTKKRKLDENLEEKQFSDVIPMVALHLSNCADRVRLEGMAMDKVSLSKPSTGGNNISNCRTLLFMRNQSPLYQGDNRVDQVRFVVEQKLNNDTVEAHVVYGCEDERSSIVYSILPAFPNVHSADLFASQFISLMAREGYDLYSDLLGPTSANIGCGPSSHQLTSTAHQSAGRFALHSSLSNPGLAHHMLSPMPGSTSAHNSGRLQSKKAFSAPQLQGHIKSSSLEITSNCLSDSQQMHEIMGRHALLQQQARRRVAQQEQLRLRKVMLEQSGTPPGGSGALQCGNGIQGLVDFGISSFDNVTGNNMASRPRLLNGCVAAGPENKRSSNALGINDSRQLIGPISDHIAAISSKLWTEEGQRQGSSSGDPIQRSGLVAPVNTPKAPEVASTLSSQLLQMYEAQQAMQWAHSSHPHMRLSVENRGPINLAKQVGSSLVQASPQQYARRPQNRHQEPNSGLVMLEEMENKNVMDCRGIVDRGHGWRK